MMLFTILLWGFAALGLGCFVAFGAAFIFMMNQAGDRPWRFK